MYTASFWRTISIIKLLSNKYNTTVLLTKSLLFLCYITFVRFRGLMVISANYAVAMSVPVAIYIKFRLINYLWWQNDDIWFFVCKVFGWRPFWCLCFIKFRYNRTNRQTIDILRGCVLLEIYMILIIRECHTNDFLRAD